VTAPPGLRLGKELFVTPNDAYEFFVELVSQLFHADVLISDQAQRIETLEAELARLRLVPSEQEEPAA
jgi:hypothetical protein